MKREKLFSCLIAAALAFCISFGGVACVVTGFSLDVLETGREEMEPAHLAAIATFCAVICAVSVLCFSFRWGGMGLVGCLMLLAGYLWRSGTLELAVEAVLYRITYLYDLAYKCGVVQWTGESPAEVSPDTGLCILTVIIALLVAWTVCRRHNAIAAVALGFAPLVSCLVVTDTVPKMWCLFLLLTGQVMLILTNTVRRRNAVDGNRLTAMVLVPTMLFMMLLFYAVPSVGYGARAEAMQQNIRNWLQSLPIAQMFNINFTGSNSSAVDLAQLGSKGDYDYPVMDVTAPESGMLYLRGRALDKYDGRNWNVSRAYSYQDTGWPGQENGYYVGKVQVKTVISHDFLYFPYYPRGEYWPEDRILVSGGVPNAERIREYFFEQRRVERASVSILLPDAIRNQCLELPSQTKSQAKEYLRRRGLIVPEYLILTADYCRQIAESIRQYVSNTAEYSLTVDTMPEDADDFAMWFLESADSGYCVHFATTATVLLRAAGIPARYVTGYVVSARAKQAVTVTADKAHAWVEYFVPGYGWQILETTPGYEEENFVDPTDPSETTEPTEEPTTEPTEEPTTEPTEPDENITEPSTEPTIPEETGGEHEKPQQTMDMGWLANTLKWIGIAIGTILLLIGQYLMRIRYRNRRMHTGPANARALARWKAVLRISRILKTEPPQALLELAEKAKFSQHDLTMAERMEFDHYLDQADLELRKKLWLKQWLIRLIWAV